MRCSHRICAYRHWDRYLCTIDFQSVLMAARLIWNRQIMWLQIVQVQNCPQRSMALAATTSNCSYSIGLAIVSVVQFDRRYLTNTLRIQRTNDQILYPIFLVVVMIWECLKLSLPTCRLRQHMHLPDSLACCLCTCFVLIHWCCLCAHWSHRVHHHYKYHRNYRPKKSKKGKQWIECEGVCENCSAIAFDILHLNDNCNICNRHRIRNRNHRRHRLQLHFFRQHLSLRHRHSYCYRHRHNFVISIIFLGDHAHHAVSKSLFAIDNSHDATS